MEIKKNTLVIYLAILCLLLQVLPSTAQKNASIKTDWKLAVQSYTFHKFSLMEALDKVQELGIHYIEVYPGHRLGEGFGELTFLPTLDADVQKRIKQEAKKRDISLIAMGVIVVDDASDWESYFSFAKNMGLEYLTAEPALQHWDEVERLVQQYDIKLAVHNHPKPSLYWHPDSLLKAIAQRDQRIGSCADVGHWSREGLDALAGLKKLNGKVLSLHFKDITSAPSTGHEMPDTIWGTGLLDIKGMLQELKKQGFNGSLAIEYENNWENSVPDIQKNLNYYYQTLNEIQ